MSQQEFENYLTLLTRLLRVAPSQREQLAQEFRAHLEDRLDELLARGVERGQAVQKAIGEFGDAAGLAVELAHIAKRRKRRFLMKVSYAGVGTLALAGLLVFALWPEGRQVQGPPVAAAQAQQNEPGATPNEPQRAVVKNEVSQAHDKIRAALDKEAQFEFRDIPLRDFVSFLGDTYGIPVLLRKGTLADAAITEDTPVTSSLKGISLRSALRLTLDEMKLTYVVEDEVLQITTPEDAESRLFTRIYDCRELLALPAPPGSSRPTAIGGGGGFFAVEDEPVGKTSTAPASGANPTEAKPAPSTSGEGFGGEPGNAPRPRELSDAEHLIHLVKTTVVPDSWDEVGGPGTTAEYKGLLVVTQTGEVHEQVERLLNMLHQAAGLEEQRVKVVE